MAMNGDWRAIGHSRGAEDTSVDEEDECFSLHVQTDGVVSGSNSQSQRATSPSRDEIFTLTGSVTANSRGLLLEMRQTYTYSGCCTDWAARVGRDGRKLVGRWSGDVVGSFHAERIFVQGGQAKAAAPARRVAVGVERHTHVGNLRDQETDGGPKLEMVVFSGDRRMYDTKQLESALSSVAHLAPGNDWRYLLTQDCIENHLAQLVQSGRGHSGKERRGGTNRGVRFWNLTNSSLTCRVVNSETGEAILDSRGQPMVLRADPFSPSSSGSVSAQYCRWTCAQMTSPHTTYWVSVEGLPSTQYWVDGASSQHVVLRVASSLSSQPGLVAQQLVVSGLEGRAISANGVYDIEVGTQCNNRPVYTQRVAGSASQPSRLVYDASSDPPAWLVEVPNDPGKAYAFAEDDALSPEKVQARWQVWVCPVSDPVEHGRWHPSGRGFSLEAKLEPKPQPVRESEPIPDRASLKDVVVTEEDDDAELAEAVQRSLYEQGESMGVETDGRACSWREGDRCLHQVHGYGTVRYVGRMQNEGTSTFVGVELDQARRDQAGHDGSVFGIRYFTCAPNHGLMTKKWPTNLVATSRPRRPMPERASRDVVVTEDDDDAELAEAVQRSLKEHQHQHELRGNLPPGIEHVPADGQCLFNAVDQTKYEGGTVHPLRSLVVKWVRDNWSRNPDISPLFPHLARLLDQPYRLHDAFDEIESQEDLDSYVHRMSKYSEYAGEKEAGIAAFIRGYSVRIYRCCGGVVELELPEPIGKIGGEQRSIVLSNRDSRWGAHYDVYHDVFQTSTGHRATEQPQSSVVSSARASSLFRHMSSKKDPNWRWVGISAHGAPVAASMVQDMQLDKTNKHRGWFEYEPGRYWQMEWAPSEGLPPRTSGR
jgi:hypothetical protein